MGLKTALPRGEGTGPDTEYPFPWTWEGPGSVVFEGYGSAGPAHAERAIEVLLGTAGLPDRSMEDQFFAQDCEFRDGLYGPYDRDGDGEADPCAEAGFARFTGQGEAVNSDPTVGRYDDAPAAVADGDVDVCFDNRITSVPAAFRPKGIFTATDQLDAALPAGSTVTATIWMQSSEPTVASLEGVLKATDREVGRSAAVQQPVHPAGWTAFELEFTTERLVAAGEQLTFQLVHAGVRSWAYGYNGDHASTVTIAPATAGDGHEFGAVIDRVVQKGATVVVRGQAAFPELGPDPQLAGFHARTELVEVAADEAFTDPVYASVAPDGSWAAVLPARGLSTVHVRALRDRVASATDTHDVGTPGTGRRSTPDEASGVSAPTGQDRYTVATEVEAAPAGSADVEVELLDADPASVTSPAATSARGLALALWVLTAVAVASGALRRRLVRVDR